MSPFLQREVLSPMTPVTVAGDIEGFIEAVRIGAVDLKYLVVWWNGRSRQAEWLYDVEFVVREPRPTTRVGFVTEGGTT